MVGVPAPRSRPLVEPHHLLPPPQPRVDIKHRGVGDLVRDDARPVHPLEPVYGSVVPLAFLQTGDDGGVGYVVEGGVLVQHAAGEGLDEVVLAGGAERLHEDVVEDGGGGVRGEGGGLEPVEEAEGVLPRAKGGEEVEGGVEGRGRGAGGEGEGDGGGELGIGGGEGELAGEEGEGGGVGGGVGVAAFLADEGEDGGFGLGGVDPCGFGFGVRGGWGLEEG